MIEVRPAGRGDVRALAAVLGRAFEDDPIARFVFPNERWRRAVLPHFFRLQLASNYLPRGEVLTTTDRHGAALWMLPETRPPSRREQLAHLVFVPLFGAQRHAMRRLTSALEARRPREAHYYLGTIGTDPHFQGQGIASALVRAMLERCDEAQVPAYLECSRAENVGFYERFGFAVRAVIGDPETGPGGPSLYLMWREARSEP